MCSRFASGGTCPFCVYTQSNVSSGFSVFYLGPMLKSKHIVQEECTLSIIHTAQCDRMELS